MFASGGGDHHDKDKGKNKDEDIKTAVSALDNEIKPKVEALLKIHEEKEKIQKEFDEEVKQLELKFEIKYEPVFKERKDIIIGVNEEVKGDGVKGIEHFWFKVP